MNSKRLYFALLGTLGIALIGIVGGTYAINKMLTTQASSLTGLKAQALADTEEQATLRKAKAEVEKYASLNKIAKAIVPQDKDQAEAVREIVNIAGQSGVSLASISFPASNLGTTATGAQAAPSTTKTTTPSASASLSQLQPVKNISGVYQLQITIQGDSNKPVSYSQFISFLQALEKNRRTAQVNTITLTPSASNRNLLTFTLTLYEYIKP